MKQPDLYLNFLSDLSNDGIIRFDAQHKAVFKNKTFRDIFHDYTIDQVDDLFNLLCDEQSQPLSNASDYCDQLISTDQQIHQKCYFPTKDKLVTMFISCCKDDSGILINLRSFRTHLWTNARVNQVMATSKMNVWILDSETGEFTIEDNSNSLLELPKGYQMTIDKLALHFDPVQAEYNLNDFKNGMTQKTFEATYHMKTWKENWVWVKIYSFSEQYSNGRSAVYGIVQDVTESKEQEIWLRTQKNQLEDNHRLLTKAEQLTKLGHWTYNISTEKVSVSNQCYKIFDCQEKGWDKDRLMAFINPGGINWSKGATPVSGRYVYQIGENQWVEANIDPYIDGGTVFGTIQDISKEIHSKNVAINNEAKQKAIINTIPNPLYYADLKGRVQMINQSFTDLFKVKASDLVGEKLDKILHLKDAESSTYSSESDKVTIHTELIIDNQKIPVTVYKRRFFNVEEEPMGVIGVIFDRTEEVQKNARIVLANKQLNLALQGASAGFFIYDIQSDINYWDERSSEIFGFDHEPQVGEINDFFERIHPDDLDQFKQQRASNYGGMDRFDNHYRIIVNGQVKYINAQGSVERDEEGAPIRIIGIHFDETEKMLNQQRLEESEEKYRRIFERIKDGYLMIDMAGSILDANPAAGSLLGYEKLTDLKGSKLSQFIRSHNNQFKGFRRRLFLENDLENVRMNINRVDGRKMIINFNATLGFKNGRSVIEATFRDVTKMVETQKKVLEATIQAENRERKRIAQDLHDSVQQLLITSKMNFEAVKSKFGDQCHEDKFMMGMKYLNQGLQESRSVSYQLMPSQVEKFGLEAELEAMIANLNASSKIEFKFEVSASKSLELDYLTKISLFRIVQESTNNVIKYSKAEEATVTLEEVNDQLIVSVVDNGIGFDPDTIQNYKHFGLSGIKNRVDSIGAELNLKSTPGKGTLIQVVLQLG